MLENRADVSISVVLGPNQPAFIHTLPTPIVMTCDPRARRHRFKDYPVDHMLHVAP